MCYAIVMATERDAMFVFLTLAVVLAVQVVVGKETEEGFVRIRLRVFHIM